MSPRRFDVDLVKAVGIVAVVWIHAMRAFFHPDVSAVELWLLSLLQFAVPGFFAASGVLYATRERVRGNVTRARLRRLLIPYAVASAAAQVFRVVFDGREPSPTEVFLDFVWASSFGPYYYVFHALLFVLATPLLARLPARALAAVTAAALLAQAVCWIVPEYRTVGVRNPLHWLGFFLAGWQLRHHEETVVRWLAERRLAVALAAGAAAALLSLHEPLRVGIQTAGAFQWLFVGCALVPVALGTGRETRSRLVRFLSDSTYTIYLFHLFFVYPLQRWLPAPAPGVFDPLAIASVWLAGLAGPLALAAAGRALLGARRSRTLLGA